MRLQTQGRRGRIAGILRVLDAHPGDLIGKHAIITAGVVLLAIIQETIWVILFSPFYLALNLLVSSYAKRVAARIEVSTLAFRSVLAVYFIFALTFSSLAIWTASHDSYVCQSAAFILLSGQALHSIATTTRSRDLAWMDVAIVAVSLQVVTWIGNVWATPTESAFMHVALGLVTVFLVHASYQADRLSRRLQTTSVRLTNAQRSGVMGEMASGIAHDFNNLLTVMRGNLELLREVPEGERAALLAEVELAARRGGDLVSRLLTTGRPEGRTATMSPLAPAMDRFAQLARGTFPANVNLVVDLKDAPETVAADAAQLELALLNLAVNARDALPAGGTILVRAETMADRRFVRLTVEDDGEGMSPEVLARATDAYETTKPAGEGTGLGLAMVKGFVEEAGGTLTLESTPGLGTQVEIILPVDPYTTGLFDAA